MFRLIIEDDEGHTTIVPLVKEEVTIGRKEGNTIRLTERNVSRHHARMIRNNGSVFIEDLDSYNGVKVNGDRISARTTIREGDLVEIGDYHLALQKMEEALDAKVSSTAETKPAGRPPLIRPVSTPITELPPPVIPTAAPAAPAPSNSDGATAVLRLPVDDRKAPEPNRARSITEDQAGRIVILTTELEGQSFPLVRTEMSVGRTEDNDIVLPHRSVSSRHAKIVYDGGIYRVIDQDSANGVLVNGEEYARVDIRKGDVIEFGHVKVRYVAPGEDYRFTPGGLAEEAAVAGPARSLVDASVAESRSGGGGLGKMLGIGLMVVVLLAGGGFAVWKFVLNKGTDQPVKPGAGDVTTGPANPEVPDTGSDVGEPATGGNAAVASEHYKTGLKLMGQGDLSTAKVAFEAALVAQPDHAGAKNMMEKLAQEQKWQQQVEQARAAVARKDYDRALEFISDIPTSSTVYKKEVESLKPEVEKNYRGSHLNIAERLESKGDLKEALKHLDAVLLLDESNMVAKMRKEKLLRKIDAAEKDRVAKLHKPPPVSVSPTPQPPKRDKPGASKARAKELTSQAQKAHRLKRFSEAISLYKSALEADPKDFELYRLIGACYALLGNRSNAAQYYLKYLELCPKCMYAPMVRNAMKGYNELQ